MYDKIWEEVKTLKENGIKVMALLGGAAGVTYSKLNGTDDEFNAYYQPLLALLKRKKKHNLDGLDIYIEEKVSISVPLRLINALYQDLGPSSILTMAPLAAALSDKDGSNLSGFSYFTLDTLTTIPCTTSSPFNLISFYNVQFYSGFARSLSTKAS
ncbi:glycoside hydrolase family 18 protein [Hyaloscypha hepaticicola]|uniref:Glycoside hydrolase family 18 protein n=1 Tax=Hyaloscypha hepaticicola TaxID=2082293 RepID=A0A2J6PLX5_9HELO|nr:glycoside hydrolase family 18 protein [Hyaloscypha hepaticicola]